jgi:hypothetical protein
MGFHYWNWDLTMGSKWDFTMGISRRWRFTLGEWHNVDQPNVVLTNIGI